ncbi:hypothetical protein [Haloarchaeobius litoreus]|uniref:Uncharacterized protein n=1 Tax=Haloarchaeobius litoreus TaxID=755306 RepID=A0ABD6DKF2_9EURY|nr:hypothetical protein [Haloarchaeobius litoreus]
MTRVPVESYDTLDSTSEISGKGAAVIAELMNKGIDTVVYIPGWMADDNDLKPVAGGKTLYVATVEDYSAKAWKVSQSDGTSEFVAKSQAVVFDRRSFEIETPQQRLGEFAGESR